jgi:type 1 glutamine amidotransferase
MPRKKVVFHIGGAYHPTEEQAGVIIGWLGADYACQMYDGVAAFEVLDDADLFVVMGMHWSGMMHEQSSGLLYRPMRAIHRTAFENYVTSGRPLLVHHAAIFSYDDWPRFGELLVFRWRWDATSFVPVTEYSVEIKPTGHPVVAEVDNYVITDELYINVQVTPGLNPVVHAATYIQDEDSVRGNGHRAAREVPMVFTAEGGRVPGAGKVVYLVNGHDMRAFECAALRQMWLNAVNWLMEA